MTDNVVLDALQIKLQDIVKPMKLQYSNDDVADEVQLKAPNVIIGYIPPKGMIPDDIPIPCVIVGYDETAGEDDGDAALINVRLTFAIYRAGTYSQNGDFTADMSGYKDLLNFIERVRIKLSQEPQIGNESMLDKSPNTPMRWGMYEEQPYPYWYGWLAFSLKVAVVEMTTPNLKF